MNDNKLTEKSLNFTTQYYSADSAAQEKLFYLDELISSAMQNGEPVSDFLSASLSGEYSADDKIFSFKETIRDGIFLKVKVKIFSDLSQDSKKFRIICWQVVNESEYIIDDTIPIWTGAV